MTTVLEHDYIGLSSEVSSMERKTSSAVEDDDDKSLVNLKETELRLGLPGCESPERKQASLGMFPLFGKDHSSGKNFVVSGAKRGFSDVSGKWVFNGDGGSESELGKAAVFLSPRAGKNGVESGNKSNTCQQNCGVSSTSPSKEAVPSKEKKAQQSNGHEHGAAPSSKAQVVGWPPIRSFRKNSMASTPAKNSDETEGKSGPGCLYVKVSMDGAPYLRKVDLKTYNNYSNLSSALEQMFSCFTIGQCGSHGAPGRDGLTESCLVDLLHGSEYVLTYEDKDGDWMLVGDVPWGMFTETCRRLRIMKGSDAIGLAPRAMEKCKNRN